MNTLNMRGTHGEIPTANPHIQRFIQSRFSNIGARSAFLLGFIALHLLIPGLSSHPPAAFVSCTSHVATRQLLLQHHYHLHITFGRPRASWCFG